MMYLSFKIVLYMVALVSAFLAVFRKTVDDKGNLTRQGRVSVVCVFVTFCISIGNEVIALEEKTDARTAQRASDDRAIVTSVKLDQALDEGKKRGEEAKAYMLDAEMARKKLEVVQAKLEEIEKRVGDPTLQKMIGDVKRMAGSDIVATTERFAALSKLLQDMHDDLGDVRVVMADGREISKNARVDVLAIKAEIDAMRQEIMHIKSIVSSPPSPPSPPDAGPDVELDGWPDGQYFLDDLTGD